MAKAFKKPRRYDKHSCPEGTDTCDFSLNITTLGDLPPAEGIEQADLILLFCILCCDDKIKLERPLLLWGPDFGRPYACPITAYTAQAR